MTDYEKIAASVDLEAGEPMVEVSAVEMDRLQREFYSIDHPKYQGIGEAKGYDQSYARIQKTRYSHEAMIDVMIAKPTITQNELAATFERSVPWISRIIGSDAFQAALAKRREEVTDPFLIATIEERFRGLAYQSLDIITEKLAATKNTDLALKGLDISVKALGFGARTGGGNQTQNTQFIIQLPPKSVNSAQWAVDHNPVEQIEASNA